MSRSDFDFYKRFSGYTGAFENGDEGLPVLHSALSTPLTSNGTYCRRFRRAGGQEGVGGTGHFSLASSVAGGVFVDTPVTKALSLRWWGRLGGSSVSGSGWGMGVACRYMHTQLAYSIDAGPENFVGYGMRFSSLRSSDDDSNVVVTPGGVPEVGLFARSDSNGIMNVRHQATVALDPSTGSPWLRDKWYRFRFDHIPTGTLADEIKAWIFTGADENIDADWTLLASFQMENGIQLYQIPAASGQRVGFYASTGGGSLTNPQPFIDSFQARHATVP